MKTCDECGGKHHAKGKCKLHYRMPSQLNPKPITPRIDFKIDHQPPKEALEKQKSLLERCIPYIEEMAWALIKIKNHASRADIKKSKKNGLLSRSIKRETLPQLLVHAEKVFNAWIRKRDTKSDGTFRCICCDVWFSAKDMDAGHFITKKRSIIRFNEDNVWGQSKLCNQGKDGNEKEYEKRLIIKIGQDRVDELKRLTKLPFKWDREYLLNIIDKYK